MYREVLRIELGHIDQVLRARTPARVPVVLGPHELRLVLDQLNGVPRLVANLLYGAGLRLL